MRCSAPGWTARTSPSRPSRRCARAAGSTRLCTCESRSGSRWLPGWAAAAPTPPRCCGSPAGRTSDCGSSPPSSGPTSPPSCCRRWPWSRAPESGYDGCPILLPHGVVLLPGGGGLSTAEVFAEADRQGLGREQAELDAISPRLLAAAGSGASPLGYSELLSNDLEPAALALRPEIGGAISALREAGAGLAAMTGSGPTAFGIFGDLDSAREAASSLDRDDAIVCEGGPLP